MLNFFWEVNTNGETTIKMIIGREKSFFFYQTQAIPAVVI